MKRIIAVICQSNVEEKSILYEKGLELGKDLIDNGYRIQIGGRDGVMEAVAKGARMSDKYTGNEIIGILPGFDPRFGNKYLDIAIPTGIDVMRNSIVANADAVIAIGGGAGTLSEMAMAWQLKRMIIAYDVEGWSGKLAGTRIDDRKRIEWEGDKVLKVENSIQVISLLKEFLHFYSERHSGIK